MKAILNRLDGLDDAICSLFLSKHTLTPEREREIRSIVSVYSSRNGMLMGEMGDETPIELHQELSFLRGWVDSLVKNGKEHITLLRFIDLSVTVYGMHRAGQDDVDSHVMRFHGRIMRNSTRIAGIRDPERFQGVSDFYEGKIMTLDKAEEMLGVEFPMEFQTSEDGGDATWVRTTNGYVRREYAEDPDVLRGLYMLSFPSDFLFRCNLAEFAHVYQMRNRKSSANPEVREMVESIAGQLEEFVPQFNRELLLSVKN